MLKHIRIFFLILSFSLAGATGRGANLSITARLDSVNVLMGNLNTLHLEVVENVGTQGRLNIFQEIDRARGYAALCGDSVELSTSYKIDTLELGSGKVQLNYSIPVQAFDSGTYTLPRFVYYAGRDSAMSNSLTFNVYPVDVTAEDPIAGFAPVVGPDGSRFYDWLPDWLLDFWWIWLVIFLAICAFLYGMKNFKRQTLPFISPKVLPKPWEIALGSLQRLKTRKLWEQGMEKEYFTELTDILRVYLFERFGINAMEMTTKQIMDKIYDSDLRAKKDYVKQILNVADFVKFAKVRPLPADSIAAYDNAVKFVEETIPSESVGEGLEQTQEGGDE
ncbi:MAG: hypothetical protein J1D77_00690 [Muribaculaceae bacterium]|nr:hypothetical protein [Muribaculaceae bacterium]